MPGPCRLVQYLDRDDELSRSGALILYLLRPGTLVPVAGGQESQESVVVRLGLDAPFGDLRVYVSSYLVQRVLRRIGGQY